MNKNLLIAGGTILIAGGIAYWYLSQQQGNGDGNGDGNGHQCIGECFYEGATECDKYNNLCKCVNGQYRLLETNSVKCRSGFKHNACFPSVQGNIMTCIPNVPGEEVDECENIGFSGGCSCLPGECDIYHFCEPYDHKCVLKALNTPISATTSNMTCFDEGGNNYCNYWLEEPVAILNLTGYLYYKWGPIPGEWVDWAIYGYYKGRWNTLKEGTDWVWGSEGSIGPIIAAVEAQGIEMLQFGLGALVSNIHVDKFIGHLSY